MNVLWHANVINVVQQIPQANVIRMVDNVLVVLMSSVDVVIDVELVIGAFPTVVHVHVQQRSAMKLPAIVFVHRE